MKNGNKLSTQVDTAVGTYFKVCCHEKNARLQRIEDTARVADCMSIAASIMNINFLYLLKIMTPLKIMTNQWFINDGATISILIYQRNGRILLL